MVYFLLSAVIVIFQRLGFDALEDIGCLIDHSHGRELNITNKDCQCAYLYTKDSLRTSRTVLEIIQIVYTTIYLCLFISELYIQKIPLYTKTILFNPSKITFIISLLLTLLIIPMRLTCNYQGEDYMIVIAIILKGTYILYLGRWVHFFIVVVGIVKFDIKFQNVITNLSIFPDFCP